MNEAVGVCELAMVGYAETILNGGIYTQHKDRWSEPAHELTTSASISRVASSWTVLLRYKKSFDKQQVVLFLENIKNLMGTFSISKLLRYHQ